jgi:hypothetical protein
MAQTFAHLLTHAIFSTKNREPVGDLNPGLARRTSPQRGRKTLAQGTGPRKHAIDSPTPQGSNHDTFTRR